jgi:hypothetical protein
VTATGVDDVEPMRRIGLLKLAWSSPAAIRILRGMPEFTWLRLVALVA